jgi:hypothetical protein
MDDLLVPIQKLTSSKELQDKLDTLGFSEITRWTGETYDHESKPETQLEDIEKLQRIAASCVVIAQSPLEQCLANLLEATSQLYVETALKVINNKTLSSNQVRQIVIGESNLRFIATKQL